MSFRCCENCLVDMICSEPCEKFEVDQLHLNDLLSIHNCLRLLKKYKKRIFRLKNQVAVTLSQEGTAIYIYKNRELHRDDGPAVIYANKSEVWYKKGKCHRDDGPAVIYASGYKAWYQNDKRHRDNGPAIITKNGYNEWHQNGKRLQDEGPTIIKE